MFGLFEGLDQGCVRLLIVVAIPIVIAALIGLYFAFFY